MAANQTTFQLDNLSEQELRTIALALRVLSEDTRKSTERSQFVLDTATGPDLQRLRDKVAASFHANDPDWALRVARFSRESN